MNVIYVYHTCSNYAIIVVGDDVTNEPTTGCKSYDPGRVVTDSLVSGARHMSCMWCGCNIVQVACGCACAGYVLFGGCVPPVFVTVVSVTSYALEWGMLDTVTTCSSVGRGDACNGWGNERGVSKYRSSFWTFAFSVLDRTFHRRCVRGRHVDHCYPAGR
jgi:hypothetical protein